MTGLDVFPFLLTDPPKEPYLQPNNSDQYPIDIGGCQPQSLGPITFTQRAHRLVSLPGTEMANISYLGMSYS